MLKQRFFPKILIFAKTNQMRTFLFTMALLVFFSTAVFSQGTFEKLLKQGNLHIGYLTTE